MVYVGLEKTERSFFDHMRQMGMEWPAVPHGSTAGKRLEKEFDVKAIPSLIILDSRGNIVSKEGYPEVNADPDGAFERWLKRARLR